MGTDAPCATSFCLFFLKKKKVVAHLLRKTLVVAEKLTGVDPEPWTLLPEPGRGGRDEGRGASAQVSFDRNP